MHKKIKKYNIGSKTIFPTSMYNNAWGSIVICAYIFSENPIDVDYLIERWKELEQEVKRGHNPIDWDIADPDFIKKTLDFFEVPLPSNFPIAFVVYTERNPAGKVIYKNYLFAPYVNGQIAPLREDGIMGRTLSKGLVYPIDFTKENNFEEKVIENA